MQYKLFKHESDIVEKTVDLKLAWVITEDSLESRITTDYRFQCYKTKEKNRRTFVLDADIDKLKLLFYLKQGDKNGQEYSDEDRKADATAARKYFAEQWGRMHELMMSVERNSLLYKQLILLRKEIDSGNSGDNKKLAVWQLKMAITIEKINELLDPEVKDKNVNAVFEEAEKYLFLEDTQAMTYNKKRAIGAILLGLGIVFVVLAAVIMVAAIAPYLLPAVAVFIPEVTSVFIILSSVAIGEIGVVLGGFSLWSAHRQEKRMRLPEQLMEVAETFHTYDENRFLAC